VTRRRRLFLSKGDASPSCCAMLNSAAVDGSSRSSKHRPNCLRPRTASKRTKVVRTELWIRRPLPRSSWGCQDRARTMREKFKMKNVTSRANCASFTVWVTDGFPVRMTTQCAAARKATDKRLQVTGLRLQVRRNGPPKADVRVL